MPLSPGATLGHYEVIALLGTGGMGEVYRATDRRLRREVAIKVLPVDRAADEDRRRRFLHEARAASALNHPNIVTIHEIGSADGIDFIVMEYVRGSSLGALVPRQGMQVRDVLRIAIPIADALERAHSRGIVHRDLKPANILVASDGVVKIVDFGLAKRVTWNEASSESETQTHDGHALNGPGTIAGTVGYMSPEQATGGNVDARSDVFSFGTVLYEMATGRRPFDEASAAEILAALLKDQPRPPSQVAPVPAALEKIILRCLEKDAARRFQSMHDVKTELQAIENGPGPAPSRDGRPRRWWVAAALMGALVSSAGAWLAWRSSPLPERDAAIDSLAVLPFANGSDEPELEYLSDGLTDSLINSLAQLRRFRVVPRSTVFRYKGQAADPQEAGRALDVRAVLSGRVTRRGEALLVAAELVDVAQRSQLWGEQYNRKTTDLLSIQTEIANEIVGRLRIELTGDERGRLNRGATRSVEAYDLYLKGLYHWSRPRLEGLKDAITYFERAIEADPTYALPHVGLSDVYGTLGYMALGRPQVVGQGPRRKH